MMDGDYGENYGDEYEKDYNRRYGELSSGQIRGWELYPCGFKNTKEALSTIDYDDPPYGSLWRISGHVFRMEEIFSKPCFVLYEPE